MFGLIFNVFSTTVLSKKSVGCVRWLYPVSLKQPQVKGYLELWIILSSCWLDKPATPFGRGERMPKERNWRVFSAGLCETVVDRPWTHPSNNILNIHQASELNQFTSMTSFVPYWTVYIGCKDICNNMGDTPSMKNETEFNIVLVVP